MSKLKRTFLKEINPLRDFENISFYNNMQYLGDIDPDSLKKNVDAQIKNMRSFILLPKKMVRGAVVGGLVGAFLSVSFGGDLQEDIKNSVVMTSSLDGQQYLFRSIFLYLKAQRKPNAP